MGNKVGKISTIKKEPNPNVYSLEGSLSRLGFQRFPSTGIRIEVYMEPNGKYRTGLDEDALYIRDIKDKDLRDLEIARVKALREHLEAKTGLDLSPNSPYYAKRNDDNYSSKKAQRIRLMDGDNVFNLEDDYQAITYAWVRVHPSIASSYQAWLRGDYPPRTQFFVNDEDIENEVLYKKKAVINKAVVELDKMSLEKRKKVARLLGLPVTDNSREQLVYNVLDTFIKQGEVSGGKFSGAQSVDLFNKFVAMNDEILNTKHLVSDLLRHSIIRIKRGRLYEGEVEVAKSEDELVERLLTPKYQDDYMAYQEKLKALKTIATI